MARIRTIKPELPQSESMGNVSREARLCFILLFTLSDDHGKLRGCSRMLASLLYPYDDDAPSKIDGWLLELEWERCIIRYKVDGASYVKLLNWTDHQRVDKPSRSKLPDPPGALASLREDSRGVLGGSEEGIEGSEEGISSAREDGGFSVAPPVTRKVTLPERSTEHRWVRDYICHRLPRLATRNAPEINEWFDAGCSIEEDILPSIDQLIAVKNGDISSFKYFTNAILSSKEAREERDAQWKRIEEKFA